MLFKQPKSKQFYIAITAFICVSFAFSGAMYVLSQKNRESYKSQARHSLESIASNASHFVSTYITESQDHVRMIASFLSENPTLDVGTAFEALESNILSKRFKVYGFVSPEGRVHAMLDGKKHAYFDDTNIRNFLDMSKSVHSNVYEGESQKSYFMVTAPIIHGGRLLGIFFGGNPHDVLGSVMASPSMKSNNMFYFLLNRDSMIISSTGNLAPMGRDFLELLKVHPNENAFALREVFAGLHQEVPSFFSCVLGAVELNVGFAPLQVEGWGLGVAIPKEVMEQEIYSTRLFLILCILGWLVSCGLMVLYMFYLQRKKVANCASDFNMLASFANHLPSGVLRCSLDEKWTIVDCNEVLLRIIGISREELKEVYHNSWYELVHPEDRALVENELAGNDDVNISLEYRLLLKDQRIVWIFDTTKIIHDTSGSWYWCVCLDYTSVKIEQAREKSLIDRYKLLFEMSKSALYEYDPKEQQLWVTSQFFKKFGYAMPETPANYYPVSLDIIHKDDMDLFKSMQIKNALGKGGAAGLLRIKSHEGHWLWCHLQQNSWIDIETGATKAIGKIDNVDEETRVLNKLRDDVQRDPFTGLYNKTATAELVQREVLISGDERGALCIIDADNFKQINDSLGHAMGDTVIKNLATGLVRIFRSDDIVGRVGGDEFIVYIKNISKLRPLLLKMDTVQDFFRQTFEDGDTKVSISCSVGIALFPKDGNSYEELYRHADKALYRSKMKKGTYSFYDKDLD